MKKKVFGKYLTNYQNKGQALVSLLFFMAMGITITTATAIIVVVNIQGTSMLQEGTDAYYAAESGIEDSLMRFIRNPNYLGETLNLDANTKVTASITAGMNNTYTFTATGSASQATRTIQVTTVYNNNILTISQWKELNN